jgi:hypothetical protein
MLSFYKFLTEALTDNQKFWVDHFVDWHNRLTRSVDFSNHLFDKENPIGGGTVMDNGDTVVFDMPTEGLKLAAPAYLADHLDKLGYDVHDFKAGLAVRKGHTRPISIAKVLSQPIAEPEGIPYDAAHPAWRDHKERSFQQKRILDEYNRDDVRVAMRSPLQIVITRDPYKVAEMSSNKPRWTSCMALGTCPDVDIEGQEPPEREFGEPPYNEMPGYQQPGQNAQYVKRALTGGAHMAYLIAAGDHDLKNPLARIMLEPFHSEDMKNKISRAENGVGGEFRYVSWKDVKPEHTVLRASPVTYASSNLKSNGKSLIQAFKYVLDSHLSEKMPLQHYKYYIEPSLYRDHDDRDILSSSEATYTAFKKVSSPFEHHQLEALEDPEVHRKLESYKFKDTPYISGLVDKISVDIMESPHESVVLKALEKVPSLLKDRTSLEKLSDSQHKAVRNKAFEFVDLMSPEHLIKSPHEEFALRGLDYVNSYLERSGPTDLTAKNYIKFALSSHHDKVFDSIIDNPNAKNHSSFHKSLIGQLSRLDDKRSLQSFNKLMNDIKDGTIKSNDMLDEIAQASITSLPNTPVLEAAANEPLLLNRIGPGSELHRVFERARHEDNPQLKKAFTDLSIKLAKSDAFHKTPYFHQHERDSVSDDVGGIPSVLSEISKRNIAYALAHDSEEVRNEALQHKDFGKILKDKQLFHEVRTNFMKPERKNTALAIYNHPDFNAKDLEYDILNSVHDEIRSNPRGFGAIKAFDDDFIAKVARDTDEIERQRVRNRFRMEG